MHMIIAAVIRRENQILLQRASESICQTDWELPNCEVASGRMHIDSLVQECKKLNVTIELTDIFYMEESDNPPIVVYNTDLLSYVDSAYWVDSKELKNLTFSKQYVSAINKLIHEYDIIHFINSEIEQTILEMSKDLGIRIEPVATEYSYRIFVHNDYGNYCPFIFTVDYAFETQNDITAIISWHITRMYADGDKSDLYFLFSNLMSIFLKCVFQKKVNVNYFSLFDPVEINAATIIFNELFKNLDTKKLIEVVKQIYSMYTFCLMLFENLVGSFSLIPDDSKFVSKYADYLDDNESYNCFSRKEHQYYFNFEKSISLLCISNGVYNPKNILKSHEWKFVDGIDGKILYQVDMDKESFNYVSYKDWDRILKVISDMQIEDYTIVCQSNHLYLLEKNNIWVFEGDFSEYWVEIEKEKILDRQSFENTILHFNRLYKWRYPVDPGRFEELISDLLETEVMIQSVRLVGKSNNADGGRDLLIYKKYMQSEGMYGTAFIIGQCKAYEKSVNKSHVRDIRDTLDYYNANGFFLAVTSGITTQLIDHLCKLKEKRDVDWWTERELFKKLRQNSYIADRYLDILEVEN